MKDNLDLELKQFNAGFSQGVAECAEWVSLNILSNLMKSGKNDCIRKMASDVLGYKIAMLDGRFLKSSKIQRSIPAVMGFLDEFIIEKIAESDNFFGETETFYPIDHFRNEYVNREMVRAILRSLTDRGYCKFASGLFGEDGEPRGSGYGLTQKGLDFYLEGERLQND